MKQLYNTIWLTLLANLTWMDNIGLNLIITLYLSLLG